jgi:putative membrane protein
MNKENFSELARQSPKGIIINYFFLLYKTGKFFLVFIPLVLTSNKGHQFEKIVYTFVILTVVILIVALLQFLFFKFKIENGHFILNQGVFFKKKSSIPLDRIQNVNFKQNLVHQIINVTQVEIQTAGAKEVEVSIKAISRKKAEALKTRLQQGVTVVSEIDEVEVVVPKSKVLFKLSFLELLKVSLSENHVKSFFWIFAITSSLFWQFEDLLKDYNLLPKLLKFYEDNESVVRGSMRLIFLISVFVILLSVIISFVRVVLKHFDQKVSVLNDGIQLSQGLFTKRDDVLKINKIQYITVVTNPLKKQLGIQSVKVNQAGSAKTKAKKRIEIVGVKNGVLNSLRKLFFGEEEIENKEQFKPAPYYLFKLFLFSFYTILILNVIMYLTPLSIQIEIIVTVCLIVYSIIINLLKYKKAYYDIEDKKLIVGAGSVATVTSIMEYYKMQNIKLVQSFIQKRRGVASVHLQTASGVIKMPNLYEKDAVQLMELILEDTCNSKKGWI